MKNVFFSLAVHRPVRDSRTGRFGSRFGSRSGGQTRRWTWHMILHVLMRSLLHTQVLDAFHSILEFFLFFDFCERRKKSFSILANSNTKIFSYKLKAESSLHTCVKFYFSRVCRTYKNFQYLITFSIKIKFCKIFFLWFFQNYRYFSTIYEIFTKLSPTEFNLCIFQENDDQILI